MSKSVAFTSVLLFLIWIGSQSLVTAIDGSFVQAVGSWARAVTATVTTALDDSLANNHRNRQIHAAGETLEEDLTNASWLRRSVRTWGQVPLSHWGGVGNTQVYLGTAADDNAPWLFFAPATDHLTAPDFLDPNVQRRRAKSSSAWEDLPQTDPLLALHELRAFLQPRGIELVVLPAPSKAMLLPQHLHPEVSSGPLVHSSYSDLLSALAAMGVMAVDPVALLDGLDPAVAPFLIRDSHWSPEAVDIVAQATARQVLPYLDTPQANRYRRRNLLVANRGDLTDLLGLPPLRTFPEQQVEVLSVFEGNRPWRPNADASVLLLGDSFANIYSQDALGWGTGSGLAEQLSFHLKQPVDKIVVNAGGAYGSREAWARDLSTGARSLDHLKVVIYEFAARELSWGDWRLTEFSTAPNHSQSKRGSNP